MTEPWKPNSRTTVARRPNTEAGLIRAVKRSTAACPPRPMSHDRVTSPAASGITT
jgi:hypothetical protein